MTSNEAPRSLEAQAAPYDLEAQTATEVMHLSLPLSLPLSLSDDVSFITNAIEAAGRGRGRRRRRFRPRLRLRHRRLEHALFFSRLSSVECTDF